MLRSEQNDLLTQTGPGTRGGRLFRSYWLPVLLSEELPENDSPPVRVKIRRSMCGCAFNSRPAAAAARSISRVNPAGDRPKPSHP
jgi:hypothetical protein